MEKTMSKKWLVACAAGFCAVGGASHACPSFANQGNEVYEVTGGTAPTAFPVVAGGNNQVEFCQGISPVNAPSAYGYVISQPDFSFILTGAPGSTVTVSTNSPDPSCDTVLLSNTPTTDWYFNDDAAGLQSYIEMPNVPEGRLDVWVGTYSGDFCQTNLIVEVVGAAPATGGDGGKPDEVSAEPQPEPAEVTTTETPTEAEAEAVEEETAPDPLPEAPTPGGDAQTEEDASTEDTSAADEAPAVEDAPAAEEAAPVSK